MTATGLPFRSGSRVVDVVELACRAPSTHNSQPWRWSIGADTIELYADPARRLERADPDGRNLMLSCGAALHHAQVAARGLGWAPVVERLPDRDRPDLLARLTLLPHHREQGDLAGLRLLELRRTDRRRFTSWPVSAERLAALGASVAAWACTAVPVTDVVARVQVEHLMSRAHLAQAQDPDVAAEHRRWMDRGATEGIPGELIPAAGAVPSRRQRFENGRLEETGREVEGGDGLLVLASPTDSPLDRLRAGEGLSALWLAATQDGLSVVPLSQVVEVAETREALRRDVLDGDAVPQLLLRVGWQAISRAELPRSLRRPVADVLVG